MLGLTRFTLLALALSASALAGPHSRQKRRHQHAERHIEERDAGNSTHALSKRAFNGRGTFYDVGLGACGQYSSPGDYMVALNSDQYGGGYPGPQCFKKITIQCNGVTVGGVTIMDECPTCPYGGLDLSRGLFTRFADESAGVIQLTWWFEGDAPAPDPTTSTWVAPSPAWTPPPSSAAPPPTSTWTPPPSTSTSTWVAPTSTSTWVEPSPSASPSPSSSSTSTWSSISLAPSSSAAASNTTNPFAIVATDNSTSTSTSLSASAAASSSAGSTPANVQSSTQGNLVAINGLVAAYGQLIVTGAGGYE